MKIYLKREIEKIINIWGGDLTGGWGVLEMMGDVHLKCNQF